MTLSGIAFDAFGTLFDLSALREPFRERVGDRGDELFQAFSERLLPMTWHATAADAYRPFPEVAALAIQSAARELEIELADQDARQITSRLASLPAYPDAGDALDDLRGRPLAVLTNGTREGTEALVEEARLAERFDHLLVADEVQRFKPAPAVYSLAVGAFGGPPESVLVVSGNEWDVAGAKLAGLRGAWVAHGRPPTAFLGVEADLVVERLADLPAAVRRLESD